ncbi:hypothetical protein BV25DRAFT_1912008 [Artomyces pyxidatus]|uniref:Uncharacterized protein n=1 Tax=Artomyces pyxidatus TaxID=48021 RepID=A0ACB8TG00_9AGAM|nr:hypothetical protein BV25DRAFT_1912008 [Artomyces pyxidatus]
MPGLSTIIPEEPSYDVHVMCDMLTKFCARLRELERYLMQQSGDPTQMQDIPVVVSLLEGMEVEVESAFRVWRDSNVQRVLQNGFFYIRQRINAAILRQTRQRPHMYQSVQSFHSTSLAPVGPDSQTPSFVASTSQTTTSATSHAPHAYHSYSMYGGASGPTQPDASNAAPAHHNYSQYPSTSAPANHTQPPSSSYYPTAPGAPYGHMTGSENIASQWPARGNAQILPTTSVHTASAYIPQTAPNQNHAQYPQNQAPYYNSHPMANTALYMNHPAAPYQPQEQIPQYAPSMPPPSATPRAYIAERDSRRTPASSSVPDVNTAVDIAVRLIEAVNKAISLIMRLGAL